MHRAWQQTAFLHTLREIVEQQSCWTLPVVQEWWPKRCVITVNSVTLLTNDVNGEILNFVSQNQFQILV